ncbi:cysteinyl-tRNA synthetase [Sphingomonas kaistensis]|uniref:Cysteine--tRNA ligase n=1 Tax=Sphingomonas kaistensis TaxID=298708 RepID=A0A7X5Y7L9_9SPHN|nr:cysteine--tRNA ligase [Sphingomonas kaistensis]NJC06673.1 cysteinyl-tRNA synthetase [Sphingomonas kaistensis]
MIRFHDTAAREKREFQPADPGRITMYVCGPTVYGRAHIGNARPAVVFDTLARLLRHTYGEDSLVYARNITDVDDKIIEAAAAEGVDTAVITERFEQHYLNDMRALGVRDPDIAPHATAEIVPMVAMIATLIERGHAYSAQGHVLFDVASDPDYGALSKRDREAMLAGARVEVAPYKRAPGDFVLWKPSADGVIGWDSPWGRGRPGWHIECSAMIRRHLGETIDIHAGGIDLVFPHHENEAAQSRCAHGGAPLARTWLHNGFVDFGAEKMSKSLGNVVTPEELFAAGHKGDVLRLALLSAHYRSPLPWTESLIAQSRATLDGLYRKAREAEAGEVDGGVLDALSDDINTPLAISRLGQIEDSATLKASANLLGLLGESATRWFQGGEADEGLETRIQSQIEARIAAKKARDFAAADRIRDALKAEGILLEDGPQGTTWRRA